MADLRPFRESARELQRLLQRALAAHRQGALEEAERLYLEALQLAPESFEAQHLLGVLRGQQGRYEEALELVCAALKAKPREVGMLANHGLILYMMKRPQEALVSFDQALAIRPDNPEALANRGNALAALQRYTEALASYDRALAVRPRYAEALNNRGLALAALGRIEEALDSFQRAVLIQPSFAEALYHRGNLLAGLRRYEEALRSYDRAVAIRPGYVEAHDNRGNALAELKRYDEAIASYGQAVALRPDYVGAWHNLGNALVELMRFSEAVAAYSRALQTDPTHVEALHGRGTALYHLERYEEALAGYERVLAMDPGNDRVLYNRGAAAQALNRYHEAVASFDKALAIRPNSPEVLYARGSCLHAMNRWREAIASYESALSVRPDYPQAQFARCIAELPILYREESEIAERREAYAQRLENLRHQANGMAVSLAKAVASRQPFYLAYQGCNDRDLQSAYGSLVCRVMARQYDPLALASPPRSGEPVRVGFVSGFFRQHANWIIPIKGWLSQLDRRRFRIFGYHTGSTVDAETSAAAALCERFVQGPLPLDRWREEIAADSPHVLIYPEIGMNPIAARLAAQRLAPVQCNSWGHPETSGFPTLDYFLSAELMEPADAEQHYSERLILLPNLSIHCEPTPVLPRLDRSEFNLRPSATVYWCAQSLYKYLPQYDQVFARIAQLVGDCQFVFIEYPHVAEITDLFRARLDRAFRELRLEAEHHCIILPRLDQSVFRAAMRLADVYLDSIGWSGCNSTLEALTHDLPMVTMAGALMRGRHSAAMLAMMGMSDLVSRTVDDYAAAAARLGRDGEWRMAVKARISANKHRLYHDRACIAALEDFLDRVARPETSRS
jgi:protein O-GlcNAc transferase